MIALLRSAFELLPRALRLRWLALVVLAVSVAVLETLAVAAVYVLIRLIDDPAVVDHSRLVALLSPLLPRNQPHGSFAAAFALLVVILYLAKNGLRLANVWARQRVCRDATIHLVSELAGRYLYAPYSFHLQHHPAALMRNLQNAVPTVASHVYESAAVILSESLVIGGITVVILNSAPLPALAGIALVLALMTLLLWLTQRRHEHWGDMNHRIGREMQEAILNTLNGMKEIRIFGQQAFFRSTITRQRTMLSDVDLHRALLANAPHLIVETAFILAVVMLVLLLQGRADLEARLLPLLGLFAYAGLRALPSMHWIVYHSNNLRYAKAPLAEIRHDWSTLAPAPETQTPQTTRHPFSDSLNFVDVTFRYPGANAPALQEVSFEIRRGETVGIVGRSGAGKTTVADLILGLLQPSEGRILVDGAPLPEIGDAWRNAIGYVPQQAFLVDDTIARNITLGDDGTNVDQVRLRAAINAAQLDHWVETLPQGLNTRVGDRGARMSGGERQRLAVARALYRDPAVMVLDEATSALDYETEAALAEAIGSLHGARTMIIIAHRLSTVRQCDRILFFNDGRLVDTGTYDELLASNPTFRRLAEAGALW